MYIQEKITIWRTITIPKSIEAEVLHRIKAGDITDSREIFDIANRNSMCFPSVSDDLDTAHVLDPEQNEGEPTFILYDDNHMILYQNERR